MCTEIRWYHFGKLYEAQLQDSQPVTLTIVLTKVVNVALSFWHIVYVEILSTKLGEASVNGDTQQ